MDAIRLDVHLEFIMAVAQKDHTSPQAPRKFTRAELVEHVRRLVAGGLQVFCVQESCGFGFMLHRELVAGTSGSLCRLRAGEGEGSAGAADKRPVRGPGLQAPARSWDHFVGRVPHPASSKGFSTGFCLRLPAGNLPGCADHSEAE